MKYIFVILLGLSVSMAAGAQNPMADLERKAAAGDTEAMCEIGRGYMLGESVPKDYVKAALWFKKGAANCNPDAMIQLGKCYREGEGVTKDVDRALFWYRKAVEHGSSDAILALGLMYGEGLGVPLNAKYSRMLEMAGYAAADGNADKAYGYLSKVDAQLADNFRYGTSSDYGHDYMSELRAELAADANYTPAENAVAADGVPAIGIVDGSLCFEDASGNMAVDADERCFIKFKVRNMGSRKGNDCVARVSTKAPGIKVNDCYLPPVEPGKTIDVKIPFVSDSKLTDGNAVFEISVFQPNGFGCGPVCLTVDTHAFVKPLVRITDFAVSNEKGAVLKRAEPFVLTLMLQNVRHGTAENVNLSLGLPKGVYVMDGSNVQNFPKMDGGEQHKLTFTIIARSDYAHNRIPIDIRVSEKFGMYAESKTVSLAFDQKMETNRNVVVKGAPKDKNGEIMLARIDGNTGTSDVDVNIPECTEVNDKTFAVVIANENYRREQSVMFAENDGRVFAKYCRDVLGLPEDNVMLLTDATLNDFRAAVSWLKKVSEAYSGEASLIFYYSGHGVPDEKTKDAYLLPTDGYGSDLITAYSLEALYKGLSECPVKNVFVFLDACFSGGERSGGEMSSARAVGVSARSTAPKGNMVVFSAAQGDETAYPYSEKYHGMFTYFLLKKLQDSQGNVSLGELGDFIKDNVVRKSVVSNKKSQTPCVQPARGIADSWKVLKLK